MSGEHDMLLQIQENEIRQFKNKLQDAEYEIEDLKEELQSLEEDVAGEESVVNDDHILVNIAKQLGIIIVPDMPQWALLLEIERAIDRISNK